MKMKKTEWIPAATLPVRDGVYEVEWQSEHGADSLGVFYNLFKDGVFSWGETTAEQAETALQLSFPEQSRVIRWRGVTKP